MWSTHKHMKLCDWNEGDAVVYLQGEGDLHMVSGITRSILSFMISGPKSIQELFLHLGNSNIDELDRGFIHRHLVQLETLGLIARIQK